MRLAVLPGDGIGPEIADATRRVLERLDALLGLGLKLETHEVGLAALRSEGTTLPERVVGACRECDGVILGPISHLSYPPEPAGGVNVSAKLRVTLDLYANIRPSRSRAGLPHHARTHMDLVVVRENTEGFYADRNMCSGPGEFMPTPDTALAIRKVTAQASRRIAAAAFSLAQRRQKKKVTAVHKANVLRTSDGLFLREVRGVAQTYPEVEYEEQLVDSAAALLVRDPQRFDVVVTTNMFGDILSEEAAELSGGLGVAASINAGDSKCMAQAQHGSAPDIEGRGIANPSSLILSGAMLLSWLAGRRANETDGLGRAGVVVERAVETLLRDPQRRTVDLGGRLDTRAFTDALCGEIERLAGG
jgi:3-isopropylmalate dehydrogenase